MNFPSPTRVLAILQARMSSSRLPGKVMAPILGQPMILRQIERLSRCKRVDVLMVATSDQPTDDPLAELLSRAGVRFFRGSLENVLDRYLRATEAYEQEMGAVGHIVRLTADCPLTDPEIVDAVIDLHLASGAEYSGNAFDRTFPDGLDAEIMTRSTLSRLAFEASTPDDREHVTFGVNRRRASFLVRQLTQSPDLSKLRWTVDTPHDLDFARRVYERLYPLNPAFNMSDIIALGPDFERWQE